MTDLSSADWRALCAELVDALDKCQRPYGDQPESFLAWRTRAALAQPEPTQDLSQLSDGYHTFAELYEHRYALCLALMRAMPEHGWYSWRHADGERCFGGNDWFIIGIEPPGGNSVTYHLPAELYPAARATGAVELEKGRPWDGHSAADVALRLKEWAAQPEPEPQGPDLTACDLLERFIDCFWDEQDAESYPNAAALVAQARALLAQPEPQGPTLDDISELCEEFEFHLDGNGEYNDDLESAEALWEICHAVLARWSHPAIKPVPVGERLPKSNDFDAEGCCWSWSRDIYAWCQCFAAAGDSSEWTHWLPHWALPVPKQAP
jgi:hypothetical protein